MRIILLTFLGLLCVASAFSQNKEAMSQDQIEAFSVVQELFKAYRNGDSTGVRSVFADNAVMMRATYKDGKSIAAGSSVDSFVKYVGNGFEQLHNELLWDYTVEVDNNLANVWTKYAFYLGGQFHHCGSETFTLYKSDSGWKIIFLADNSQTEGCELPDDIRSEGEKNK